jgi:phosphatidylglycerol:prolipoprotein diacylglycerol transferase
MYPNLFTIPAFDLFGRHIGPITLHTYGVLLAIAFLAGLWAVARQARKVGLDSAKITDLAIYTLIAGLIGAKLLLVVVEWRFYRQHPGELWSVIQSGGVFYGGLIAALPVAWWYARKYGMPGWQTADVLAPGVAIGQAVGRLGCLAAGCCHGRPTTMPWAITFRDVHASRTVGTPLDIPLHPTQIYESLATGALFLLLLWLAPRKRFHGQVALTYVAVYAVARFVIEFYRGDAVRGVLRFTDSFTLSTSQLIAILMLVGVAAVLPYVVRKERVEKAAAA